MTLHVFAFFALSLQPTLTSTGTDTTGPSQARTIDRIVTAAQESRMPVRSYLSMSSYSCDLCCVYECKRSRLQSDAYTHATPFRLLRDVHRHAPSKGLP